MMEKQDISAGVDKNLTKKLHVTDFIRTFAAKFGKVTSIMLPFDSRKSRKFPRISQWLASDAHTYMAWAAPAVLLIRGVREPTWTRWRRVGLRLFVCLSLLVPAVSHGQSPRQTKNAKTKELINNKPHKTMPQIIKTGGGLFSKGELLRINPSNNTIESSANGGRSWVIRCNNTSYGTFRDLLAYGREILAATSRGVYVSTNAGRSFSPRCVDTVSYGDFLNLQDEGDTLLANTTKGLYYSTNGGRGWVRR